MSKTKSSKTTNEKEDKNPAKALPGWPGYRTRDGRSGYDPIDARTEAAHSVGTLLQRLLTGQLIIRNPIYLIILGVIGLVFIAPLILAISELVNGNSFLWDAGIFFVIIGIIGIVVLINFLKNLIRFIH
jgi:hypothetical protein